MKKLTKLISRLSKDLNPKKVDLQYTKSGEKIKLLQGDSCIKIDKNSDITIRLSKKSKESVYPVLAFLLMSMETEGHKQLIDTVNMYDEYCDIKYKEEKEKEKGFLPTIPQHIQDNLSIVVHAMYVPMGEYKLELFDELPLAPNVKNVRLIIEHEQEKEGSLWDGAQ